MSAASAGPVPFLKDPEEIAKIYKCIHDAAISTSLRPDVLRASKDTIVATSTTPEKRPHDESAKNIHTRWEGSRKIQYTCTPSDNYKIVYLARNLMVTGGVAYNLLVSEIDAKSQLDTYDMDLVWWPRLFTKDGKAGMDIQPTIDKLSLELNEKQKSYVPLQLQQKKHREQLTKIYTTIKEIESGIQKLHTEIKTKMDEMQLRKDKKGIIHDKEKEIEQLTSELEQYETTRDKNQTRHKILKAQYDALVEKLKKTKRVPTNSSLNALEREKTATEKDLRIIHEEIETMTTTIPALQKVVSEKQREETIQKKELEEAIHKKETAEQLKTNYERIKKIWEKEQTEIKEIHHTIKTYKTATRKRSKQHGYFSVYSKPIKRNFTARAHTHHRIKTEYETTKEAYTIAKEAYEKISLEKIQTNYDKAKAEFVEAQRASTNEKKKLEQKIKEQKDLMEKQERVTQQYHTLDHYTKVIHTKQQQEQEIKEIEDRLAKNGRTVRTRIIAEKTSDLAHFLLEKEQLQREIEQAEAEKKALEGSHQTQVNRLTKLRETHSKEINEFKPSERAYQEKLSEIQQTRTQLDKNRQNMVLIDSPAITIMVDQFIVDLKKEFENSPGRYENIEVSRGVPANGVIHIYISCTIRGIEYPKLCDIAIHDTVSSQYVMDDSTSNYELKYMIDDPIYCTSALLKESPADTIFQSMLQTKKIIQCHHVNVPNPISYLYQQLFILGNLLLKKEKREKKEQKEQKTQLDAETPKIIRIIKRITQLAQVYATYNHVPAFLKSDDWVEFKNTIYMWVFSNLRRKLFYPFVEKMNVEKIDTIRTIIEVQYINHICREVAPLFDSIQHTQYLRSIVKNSSIQGDLTPPQKWAQDLDAHFRAMIKNNIVQRILPRYTIVDLHYFIDYLILTFKSFYLLAYINTIQNKYILHYYMETKKIPTRLDDSFRFFVNAFTPIKDTFNNALCMLNKYSEKMGILEFSTIIHLLQKMHDYSTSYSAKHVTNMKDVSDTLITLNNEFKTNIQRYNMCLEKYHSYIESVKKEDRIDARLPMRNLSTILHGGTRKQHSTFRSKTKKRRST
jgi:hypothetical protein